MPKLCFFGCAPSGVPMHCFPNLKRFPERFKAWVNLVGGRLDRASDYEYYQKKLVCDIHFLDEHRTRNNRLSILAITSLNIPGRQSAGRPNTNLRTSPIRIQPSNVYATNTEQLECCILEQGHSGSSHTSFSIPKNSENTVAAVLNEHNYCKASRPSKFFLRKGSKNQAIFSSKLKYLQTEVNRLKKRASSYKLRLDNAKKMSEDRALLNVIANMRTPAQLFVHMQLQDMKKPKGRRFSSEEKILALSLYKKSPKSYALLYKYFTLPSSKAMKRLLGNIKLSAGINPILFQKIKETVLEKDVSERLCSLIFDEMSLTPQIFYNKSNDRLEGFTTCHGNKFADHALVFMIKGIKRNFKQPVAYYFTCGLKKIELKNIIKLVISEVQKSGLIIINSVCDQSTVNVAAVTELVNDTRQTFLRRGKEWRHDMFTVNGQEIIPLYDVPHLLKGIRNNLLNKDMTYSSNREHKMVKWEYYQQVYTADKACGELRLLHKITEEHITPEKINKMKVKNATQIFSHSVGVVTDHLVARGNVPKECQGLIDITLLLDNLFDSLNGNSLNIPNGKIYKGPIRRHSPHHQLWQKAKEILNTVKFIKKKVTGNKICSIETSVPSVSKFIKTINGMEAICKRLFNKYGYDAVLGRNFNQDPVENFFGNIRSYGARNNYPNTVGFEGAFKALLLCNYNLPHSKNSNCENDGNETLQGINFFLNTKTDPTDASDILKEEDNISLSNNVITNFYLKNDMGQRNYVCGWVVTKCFKKICNSCKECRLNLIDSNNDNSINNSYIKVKEYNKSNYLCYPNKAIENCFHDIQNITESFLKRDIPNKNVKNKIKSVADVLVKVPFKCQKHAKKCKDYFFDITISVIIYSWCRSINRILSGKINYENGDDDYKIAARMYYNKHKHYKNKK